VLATANAMYCHFDAERAAHGGPTDGANLKLGLSRAA
jgi:hypothetical protein